MNFGEGQLTTFGDYQGPRHKSWTDGDYSFDETYADCTGLAPWWGTPKTTTARGRFFQGLRVDLSPIYRNIEASARAAAFAGFYPYIKITFLVRTSTSSSGQTYTYRSSFKIETGKRPCVW
jgi:hypothetical protein